MLVGWCAGVPTGACVYRSTDRCACGGSGGTPQELVGTYTATISASGQPKSRSSLILKANGTFDFPDIRSRNGKFYVSGSWTASSVVVTLTCSSGLLCSSAHALAFRLRNSVGTSTRHRDRGRFGSDVLAGSGAGTQSVSREVDSTHPATGFLRHRIAPNCRNHSRMIRRMRLTSAWLVVRNLDRSTEFYGQLLGLRPTMTTSEATLLSAENGDHLALRVIEHAKRSIPALGVQSLVWTAKDREDLDRCRQLLERLDALVSTWNEDDITVVEGRDPDGLPVIVTFPAGPGRNWAEIPRRIFSY